MLAVDYFVPQGLSPSWVTTRQAARHLGLSDGYLSSMRCWKIGPAYMRVRGKVRYLLTDLEAWRQRQLTRRR